MNREIGLLLIEAIGERFSGALTFMQIILIDSNKPLGCAPSELDEMVVFGVDAKIVLNEDELRLILAHWVGLTPRRVLSEREVMQSIGRQRQS